MNMNLSDNIDKARKICEKVTEENEEVKVESQKLSEEKKAVRFEKMLHFDSSHLIVTRGSPAPPHPTLPAWPT